MKVFIKRDLFQYLIAIVYVGILVFCVKWMFSSYLWFDEAGQFWISKGLNHDSDPLSPIGGLVDVIKNNQDYNLDPGLFSIVLHYWSLISNGYMWLRMLPFIFFLGVVYCFYYLTYYWTKNRNIALLAGLVPFINTVIFPMAFEIRAYSMETLGVLLSLIAMESIKERQNTKNLIIWSLTLSILMLSRYSFIIVAFFASLYIVFRILQSKENPFSKISKIVVYALPFIIVLAYIYFFALRYQNPDIMPLDYLPYLSTNPNQLKWNENFLYVLYLLGLIYVGCHIRTSSLVQKYEPLIFLTISVNIMFIVLSLMGRHPWGPDLTRCISMITLVVLTKTALLSEVSIYFEKEISIKYMFLMLFVVYFGNTNRKAFKPCEQHNTLTQIEVLDLNQKQIYLDRWESPCIRYQIEFGQLKGKIENYPNNYYAQKAQKHNRTTNKISSKDWYASLPKPDDLIKYDILIAPELFLYNDYKSIIWVPLDTIQKSVWIKKEETLCPDTTTSL